MGHTLQNITLSRPIQHHNVEAAVVWDYVCLDVADWDNAKGFLDQYQANLVNCAQRPALNKSVWEELTEQVRTDPFQKAKLKERRRQEPPSAEEQTKPRDDLPEGAEPPEDAGVAEDCPCTSAEQAEGCNVYMSGTRVPAFISAQDHLSWEAIMAWQAHPTASAGNRFQGPNKRTAVFNGLWSLPTGQDMLYFACHTQPVRLTEHLRGTRKSEQKKKSGMRVPQATTGAPQTFFEVSSRLGPGSHYCGTESRYRVSMESPYEAV